MKEGEFIKHKGRLYCWNRIDETGKLRLSRGMVEALEIEIGSKLLCIRGSDIAFCMGLKGELIERAENYNGEIEIF